MTSAHDVAAYILRRRGAMTKPKLGKLLHYSQAWHVAWDDEPLFDEKVEAWANGPVVPAVFQLAPTFTVGPMWPGDPDELTYNQTETIDRVVDVYGQLEPVQLSELSMREQPWRDARKGLGPVERGDREITLDSMRTYYRGLEDDPRALSIEDLEWPEG